MKIEAALRRLEPSIAWPVKNQARMHEHNGDSAHASVRHAMEFWPETATAVAIRRSEQDDCEITAPFGLGDLFGLVVRPTPRFAGDKRDMFEERVRAKKWLEIWRCCGLPDGAPAGTRLLRRCAPRNDTSR
jgi:uncharacterized protein